MKKFELYAVTDILNSVLDNYLKGSEAEEVIAKLEESVLDTSLITEGPFEDELEKASFDNAQKNYKEGFRGTAMQAFNEGAEWQETKNQEVIETAIHHAYHNGKLEMKEQMMEKAVDGYATFEFFGIEGRNYGTITHTPICFDDFGIKVTDKVKMILIKES